MTVTWIDVGRPEKPGSYIFMDGTLIVRPDEIAIWREHPDAVFSVIKHQPLAGKPTYGLSTHKLPER